eukprot:522225-Karenia_brevis.AAC.1
MDQQQSDGEPGDSDARQSSCSVPGCAVLQRRKPRRRGANFSCSKVYPTGKECGDAKNRESAERVEKNNAN